jgi:hypothetical protein
LGRGAAGSITRHRLAVDDTGPHRLRRHSRGDQRIARGEIVAVPGQEANTGRASAHQQPEPIVLNFMDPVWPGRWTIGQGGKAWFNKTGRGDTQHGGYDWRHTVLVVPATFVFEVQVVVRYGEHVWRHMVLVVPATFVVVVHVVGQPAASVSYTSTASTTSGMVRWGTYVVS